MYRISWSLVSIDGTVHDDFYAQGGLHEGSVSNVEKTNFTVILTIAQLIFYLRSQSTLKKRKL